MRIKRIHIGSFGALRDRTYNLEDGLTVIYGPNESGKSSIRSFIAGTLYPDKFPPYPAVSAADSGEIDIVTKDGEVITIHRTGRKSDSPASSLSGVSSREYRSVFSLDTDDLRDVKGLDDVAARLLSVAGASGVPSVISDIDAERKSLLPDSRRSDACIIGKASTALSEAEKKLKELESSTDDRYNDLAAEEVRITDELAKARDEERKLLQGFTESRRKEGREEALHRISELEEERKQFEYASSVDPGTGDRFVELSTRLRVAGEEVSDIEKELAALKESSADVSCIDAARLSPRVESLVRDISRYTYLVSHDTGKASKGIGIRAFLGILLIPAGAVTALVVGIVPGVAVCAAGAILIAISMVKKRRMSGRNGQDPEIARIEREWQSLCVEFAMTPSDIVRDTDDMMGIIRKAADISDMEAALENARNTYDEISERIELMASPFGSVDALQMAVTDRKELDRIDDALKTLRSTVSADVECSKSVTEEEYEAARERITSLNGRLSEVRQEMKGILSNEEVEEAHTALAQARQAYREAVRRWTVLAIEGYIVGTACDALYDKGRPAAYSDADRFLDRMTDGRYRLVTDRRETGLVVEETTTGIRKEPRRLSAGAGDQVKLAFKMAVAKGLSDDAPPAVFDDVLLTSDYERKRGAAAAIVELSRSIQVLYFTCSREDRDILVNAGGHVIDIK